MSNVATLQRGALSLRTLGLGLTMGGLLVWSGVAAAAPVPDSFSGLAKKVTPAVVNIAASHRLAGAEARTPELPFSFPPGSPFERFFKQFEDQFGGNGKAAEPPVATGLGSGFIIDPSGYVVTNNHVVDAATDIQVRLEDESVYPATVVGVDAQTDLALLKIDAGRPLPAVQFGDSDRAEVGDWVVAVGNPFGLGGTVTAGIISARSRNIDAGPYDDFLQIDAPINQGNSGGPLFDLDGRVIGVNTAIFSPNGGSVGIGFAIPAAMAKTVVAALRDHGKVERGWLGVMIQKVTDEMASALGLDGAAGAIVTEVKPDGPAAAAGLRQGDVILAFDGTRVSDARTLARLVAARPAGTAAPVTVWRDRAEHALSVVTGEQPARVAELEPAQSRGQGGAWHSEALGADLAALTPERRAETGIGEDVAGVLVTDVKSGSVFEQGLRPGDVIKEVARTPVTSPEQVEALVEKARSQAKGAVLMLVSRQGHDLFLGLKLGVA